MTFAMIAPFLAPSITLCYKCFACGNVHGNVAMVILVAQSRDHLEVQRNANNARGFDEITHECAVSTNGIAGGERPLEDGSDHGVRAFPLIAAPARQQGW